MKSTLSSEICGKPSRISVLKIMRHGQIIIANNESQKSGAVVNNQFGDQNLQVTAF